MSKKSMMMMVGLLMIASMVLSACQPTATVPAAPAEPTAAAPAEPTAAPAEPVKTQTTRTGGWLDEIVISTIDSASVVTQLKADAMDIYANGLGTPQLPELNESGLPYSTYNGTYYSIIFNPAVFTDTTVLNPFSNRKIREAFNYLIDRNYINQEYYAGGALPKWFTIMTNFGDYADLAETARALEAKYAYNFDTAKAMIDEEIQTMGVKIENGKYMYNGQPLKVTFLIRSDGDLTRKGWGNYLADQMEKVGFTVERKEGAGSDLSPLWISSEPTSGQWSLYTGGWGASVLKRDERNAFQEMYLNTSQQGLPLLLANVSDPAFQKVGDDLYNGAYNTLEERHEMMKQALELSLQDSVQVMVVDSKTYVPFREGVQQPTTDLAAGVESAQISAYTLRFQDKEGGTMRWTTQDFLFSDPWNPIAGSNTTSDQGAQRLTQSYDFIYDPYTGLVHPFRAEKATVTALKGLPIQKTLDWVTLETADKIEVPEDAWVDWDAKTQTFIAAKDKKDADLTAKVKIEVTYPADVFEKAIWHDGSNAELSDLLMNLIVTFERANKDSAIYDAQAEPTFEMFKSSFRGFRIVSEAPLKVEWYTNNYSTDAELTAYAYSLWPTYTYGEASWPAMAMMNKAEADGKLVYSAEKAAETKLEQTSLIGGPSLEILTAALDELIAGKTIPYEATLGKYLTADQAVKRYEALKAFYTKNGNYLQGTGPYYLASVDMNGKSLVLKHFDAYTDLADRWDNYAAPRIAEVEIESPSQVSLGQAATFDVYVSYDNQPYANADIKKVKYLIYDATNKVVAVDEAKAVEDGHYVVELTAEQVTALGEGANRLEVAVVPIVVAQPTFSSVDFVTVK